MRILVACEFSGTVRDAFLARGFNAISCDTEPSDSPNGEHYQGNVLDIIDEEWDLIIAHPPCTYLCNSGVRWLHTIPGRRQLMRNAARFFKRFLDCKCQRVCVENPIPHKYAMEIIKVPYSQIIQPWMFGHGETKATCLTLKGLPHLESTDVVSGREQRIFKMSPGPNRGRLRSITYPGIALAMAEQWGALLGEEAVATSYNTPKPKRSGR